MAWVKVLDRLVAVRQLLGKLPTVISERDYVPKYQGDSLAGQPIARDGLSMGCPAMPFGNWVRELERKIYVENYVYAWVRGGGGHVAPQE